MNQWIGGSRTPLALRNIISSRQMTLIIIHCAALYLLCPTGGFLSGSTRSCYFALSSRATIPLSSSLRLILLGAASFLLAISAMSNGIGYSTGSPSCCQPANLDEVRLMRDVRIVILVIVPFPRNLMERTTTLRNTNTSLCVRHSSRLETYEVVLIWG